MPWPISDFESITLTVPSVRTWTQTLGENSAGSAAPATAARTGRIVGSIAPIARPAPMPVVTVRKEPRRITRLPRPS